MGLNNLANTKEKRSKNGYKTRYQDKVLSPDLQIFLNGYLGMIYTNE